MFSGITSKFVHELSRSISKRVPLSKKKREAQVRAKSGILNLDGKCEYCESGAVGRGGGDHFKPLVYDKMPSIYCHEPINIIPVCSTCNCSKQSRDFFEWYTNASYCKTFPLSVRRRVIAKMKRYSVAFQKYHTTKRVPKVQVRCLLRKLATSLKCIQEDMKGVEKKTRFVSSSATIKKKGRR
jgi:hypothetical protein